jgi:membrane protein YdbS with pleckstrin-like domain
MIQDKAKFVLKPNLKSAMLPVIIKNLITFIVGLIIMVVMSVSYGKFFVIPIGLFILIIINLWSIVPHYFDYRKREYRFFSNKLEYFDGWWVINRHVVPYKKVTDITLRKRIWNRIMNTGTIALITAGSTGGHAYLIHVSNPEKIYEHLQREILKI